MRERPILFNGEMVRAILDGRKSMTRRVIKPRPPQSVREIIRRGDRWQYIVGEFARDIYDDNGLWAAKGQKLMEVANLRCPFGAVGDRLYVRETWSHGDAWYPDSPALAWKNCRRDGLCTWVDYRADYVRPEAEEEPVWSPSIHMPRWASRLTLEVTGVRVERVSDISEEDAQAEGVYPCTCRHPDSRVRCGYCYRGMPHVSAFCRLWNELNEKRGYGWDARPWVWVAEFRTLLADHGLTPGEVGLYE